MTQRFTKEMVDDYADKLLIGLTEEENKMVLDEFEIIDQNIDLINEIPNIENVIPMTHALDNFEADFREDIVEESVPVDDLLKNSDDNDGSEIIVPRMVG